MTLRFLPQLVSRCESVTLIVRPELVRLMEGHGATIIDSVPIDVTEFGARVTFFNSIFTMGHSLHTIPSEPYVDAKFKFSGGKMGIAWSGHSQVGFKARDFLQKLNTSGFELFALQKAEPISRVVTLDARDFAETAELMATLDVIVTVDTAAAHLAGAIGHPNVFLLLPYLRDWRWWHAETWYPKIRLFPQLDPDDWSVPFAQVNEALPRG
jgi:hypothetical protein